MYQIILSLLLFAGLSCGKPFDSATYQHSYSLSPLDYTVYWNVDMNANELHLALKVKTTGWIGFGIAEISSGSMPGADIMVGYVDSAGKGHVTDRWSYDRVEPVVDDCQGVTLVSAEESDGYTILEVIRAINTSDPQDRSVVYGPNRIIVSFGTDDKFGYHGTNRKTGEITFFGTPLYVTNPVPGESLIELRMSDFVVPNSETVYACQSFAVPADKDYTITQIDPVVKESNVAHVHHFLAHVCTDSSLDGSSTPLVTQYRAQPQVCSTPLGQVTLGCTGILSAWAAGGGPSYTPPEAGFAMGLKSTSIKYIILEVHYNNPGSKANYTDNSGIRIHYSTTPRKYEADVITLGDPFTSFKAIPANSVKEYETECLSDCTSKFPHDIIAFQSFPHMHQVGSKIWTTQWRNGSQIDEFGRVEFWTFNHQLQEEINIFFKTTFRESTSLSLFCPSHSPIELARVVEDHDGGIIDTPPSHTGRGEKGKRKKRSKEETSEKEETCCPSHSSKMPHGIVYHQFGEAKDVLTHEEVAKPTIQQPSQVLIRVSATPVNPSDLGTITGTYGVKPSLPHTPGMEGMGVVEEVGDAVKSVKVGQRVHFATFGSWKDYVIVDEVTNVLVPLPDQVSDHDGAQLTVNPLTVVAMVTELNVKSGSGDFLLQSAAGSALGRIMIQYAKSKGFKTINIVRRDEQKEELKKLGADHVINSETEDIIAKVKEITKDAGVKYAVDCVGGVTGTKMIQSLTKKGTCYVYGRQAKEPIELEPSFMITRGVTIRGFWLMEWVTEPEGREERLKTAYGDVIRLIATKEITLAVETFQAKDFQAALDHCKKPGKNEKTLLLFNQK